jgi:UDP-2,3-diacylglucosamine pyrophosphatase LpxH
MKSADTIIISDIHLGSPLARVKILTETLKSWKFNRLIILGDLMASSNLGKLMPEEWKLLKLISKYVNDGIEVVWVEGNHDIGAIDPLGHLLGVTTCETYEWNWFGKKCIAVHGHQFDNIIGGVFAHFISWVYLELLRFTWLKKHFGEEISVISRKWQRIVPDVAKGCFELASKNNKQIVLAGHTHFYQMIKDNNITYINTGCFVEDRSSLVALMETGEIETFHYYETN